MDISVKVWSALVGLLLLLRYHHRRRAERTSNPRGLPYPPGPQPELIIGNARHIPSRSSWLQYTEWKKSYGDIVHLEAMGDHIIILNSYRTAHDLVGLRAAYADRPVSQMISILMGWDRVVSSAPHGEKWKRYRKILHPYLHRETISRNTENMMKDTHRLLSSLMDSPDQWDRLLRLHTGRLIIMYTYGHKVESAQDEYITVAEEAINSTSTLVFPGAVLVDIFPMMRFIPSWFPGATWKRNVKKWRKMVDGMVERPFQRVKAELAAGTALPSVTSAMIQDDGYDPEDITWCAGSLFAAGADTTYGSFITFILVMAKNLDVQKKAQAELDRMIKPGTLPTWEDRDRLPYVECLMKELLRWCPVAPLALPHALSGKGDFYDGYYIPRDSVILANVWAISQDRANYEDPARFYPERFENPETAELDPRSYVFGFGRRTCAGQNFADASLFLLITYILSTFDIGPPRDEDGRELALDPPFTSGVLCHPEPFKCTIRPRSEAAVSLIKAGVDAH
ncbi:hypothetical protein BOTBODRAFT_107607 [Botryobasidium botryosum FD-172 SS1]|uniref:Cytochrome P450 n=1 Tax=Botryobasidium botryosum (strain FD-172 SS1) TaxID=930990 RepID=A0A067MK70_BOTB1|nr:hypothetical protein BOTBODRAFT_107607 [Botryobasidium botryosum FD-172 SS1]